VHVLFSLIDLAVVMLLARQVLATAVQDC